MTLLIDQGNSRWKIATAAQVAGGPLGSGDNDDLDGLRAILSATSGEPGPVFLASVANAASSAGLLTLLREDFGHDVVQLRSTDPMPGIRPGYRQPQQLGVDRLLAMVAVRAQCREAFCVVDAGTAVTIDCVDAGGQHLGGCIAPGLGLSRECLLANTAIPRVADIDPDTLLGVDTATAVALGARYAVAGMVDRLVGRDAGIFTAKPPRLYLGGGDGDCLGRFLLTPYTRMNDLVLRGLAVIAAGRQ
jgi:type III pantothenate kinase